MRFIDEAKVRVIAGNGGDGAVSFRREKYIPKGGPDGGDGGRGASIFLEGSHDVQTLVDFRYLREYRGEDGQPGRGSQCNGRAGEDLVLKIPLGTIVRSEDGEIEEEILREGQMVLVAKGGKGGLGNLHFKSSTRQTPRIFLPGEPGEERELELELKLLSHVGLVGFPNAGKSTLLRALTKARPKVADYPFTTLTPQLGVFENGQVSFTIADIPGLIEGAHQGRGLGIQFLRHISRAAFLLFVVAFDRNLRLERAYYALLNEIRSYDYKLLNRPRLLCVNKADLLEQESEDAELFQEEWKAFSLKHPEAFLISAKRQHGLDALTSRIEVELLKVPASMVS